MLTNAIFGPPGTGKTTELLRLVEDAVQRGYGRYEIGFFSFTRAAAGEALKRLGIRQSDKICTLHSLAFRAAGVNPQQMVDGRKLRAFGKEAGIPFSGSSSDEYGEQMEEGDKYIAIYDRSRARLISHEKEYYEGEDRPGDFAQFQHCVQSYENWKKAYGFVDYTDLLIRYIESPINHGAKIVYIDESQDLSPLQWKMVDVMLSFDQVAEATIAGDDDQAIYEWAGADPHGMANWVGARGATVQVLSQSYRVPKSVHEVAREVVARIKNRVKKSYRSAPRPGRVVRYGSGFDVNSLQLAHGQDVMILCRSGTQKQEVEEALIGSRLPYKMEGGRPGLFDSYWAQALRTWFKLSRGENVTAQDLESFGKAATLQGKQLLSKRDIRGIVDLGPERAVSVPAHLVEFFREADLSSTPTIRVSTIHAAKGREAQRVILHTGITGRTQRGMVANPDAEARVWYVGVTRAKEQLDVVTGADMGYEL